MGDTNYLSGVIRIIETPKHRFLNNNNLVASCRVELPAFRSTQIVQLECWGNVAKDFVKYYKINDYIIVEGYASLQNKSGRINQNFIEKKLKITAFRIYPCFIGLK